MPLGLLAAGSFLTSSAAAWVKNTNLAGIYNAQAREYEFQARLSTEQLSVDLRNFDRAAAFRRGSIRLGLGASGLDVHAGSPLEVQLQQARADGIQKLHMQAAAELQARNFRMQAAFANYNRQSANTQRFLDLAGAGMQATALYAKGS
jgi:hypothetical protein